MNIIEFLEMQEETQEVQVFLYEEKCIHMIGFTSAKILSQSTSESFRSLKIVSVGKVEDTLVVVVKKGE